MRADVAFFFHFQPSEMDAMTVDDLLDWIAQAGRIHAQIEEA